jgi:hypothetical protein
MKKNIKKSIDGNVRVNEIFYYEPDNVYLRAVENPDERCDKCFFANKTCNSMSCYHIDRYTQDNVYYEQITLQAPEISEDKIIETVYDEEFIQDLKKFHSDEFIKKLKDFLISNQQNNITDTSQAKYNLEDMMKITDCWKCDKCGATNEWDCKCEKSVFAPEIPENKETEWKITQKELDKPEWSRLDWEVLKMVASLATFGGRKHKDDDFTHTEIDEDKYFSKIIRHITAGYKGEIDPETGLSHYINGIMDLIIVMNKRLKDEKRKRNDN